MIPLVHSSRTSDREWKRLGVHRLALALLLALAGLILLFYGLFWWTGLQFDLQGFGASFWPVVLIAMVWAGFTLVQGPPSEWFIPDTLGAFVIMTMLSLVLAPGQYAAAALGMPVIDPWLAAGDAWLGVHVPSLAAWTAAHPTLNLILCRSYQTLVWQFLLIIPLLGFVYRDREAVWEHVFHYYFCAAFTVICFALAPAACAFQYYGFQSTLDQTRFINHFNAAHTGTMTTVLYRDLEGLVSMPSFHVAGGLMCTWAVRRHLWLLVPFGIVNTLLVVSTFMTGAHYVIDTPASILMFVGSVLAYRRWGFPLLHTDWIRARVPPRTSLQST